MRLYSDEGIEQVKQELKAWCEDRNIAIEGCGCCGSPWLSYVRLDGEFRTDDIGGLTKQPTEEEESE